jgi:hypothetical protein
MPLFLLLALLLPASASLKDLAFVTGAWRGGRDGSAIEEHWMRAEGDAMVGMFRMVKDGKTVFTELMSFEQRMTGVVFVLRHFHPGLRGWEEKDAPLEYPLAESASGRVVFAQEGGGTRFVYEAQPGGRLKVTVHSVHEGQPRSLVFEYVKQEKGQP